MKTLCFLWLIFFSSAYAVESALPLHQDQTALSLGGDFFYRTASYGSNGDIIPMGFNDEYYLVDGNFRFGYGVTADLELGVKTRVRNVSSSNLSRNQNASGIEGYGAYAKFRLVQWHSMLLTVVGEFWKTAYTNNLYTSSTVSSDELVLGNDGSFSNFGALLKYKLAETWTWDLDVRFQNTPSYLSQYVSIDSELRMNYPSWAIGFGVRGNLSLKNDPYKDDPSNKPLFANGLTSLWNGINQENILATGSLSYKTPGVEIRGGIARTFYGINTDEGTLFSLDVTFTSQKKQTDKQSVDNSFKEYSNSALVIQVSPRGNFLKIDQGITTNLEKGTLVDIFQSDFFGGNILIARGIIYQVEADTSVVKIKEVYKEIPIKKGHIARIR